MNAPKNISSAHKAEYIIKDIRYKYSDKVLVVMEPRFYNHGMKAQVSFWVSRNYAKRLVGEERYMASF